MAADSGRLGASLTYAHGRAPGSTAEQRGSLGRRKTCLDVAVTCTGNQEVPQLAPPHLRPAVPSVSAVLYGVPADAPVRTVQPRSTENSASCMSIPQRVDRHTGTRPSDFIPLYSVFYKGLLATALPGRPSKQAPRFHVTMLEALEKVVTDPRILQFLRMYALWMLVQSWCTLRFSDHRGISPSTVSITGSALSAVVPRSKTIGADKSVGSRPMTVDSCCYLAEPTWIQPGFSLLQELAPFPRDHPLPSPASILTGAITAEMRYESGYGLQNRVLLHLQSDGEPLHIPGTTQFWTLHSGRAFLPSATALVGFEKSDRDFLGGWSA